MATKALLAQLKTHRLDNLASFWVIHRRLEDRKAVYKTFRVNIEPHLKRKLRDLANETIAKMHAIAAYDFEMPHDDEKVLWIDADEGGFTAIREQIEQGTEAPVVSSAEDLVNSWGTVAKFSTGGEPVYTFRKVSNAWTTKKVGGLFSMNAYFDKGMLIDLDDKPVFRIEMELDFIVLGDTLFILDKERFELALNYRERMVRDRDLVVGDFRDLGLFTEPDVFTNVIADRLPLLRKVASVRKNAYYKDPQYIASMKQQAQAHGWPIVFKGTQIVATTDNVELWLRLVNNDRLQSPINNDIFDVMGKQLVTPGAAAAVPMLKPAAALAPAQGRKAPKAAPSRGRTAARAGRQKRHAP
jgi:hypothetical protein